MNERQAHNQASRSSKTEGAQYVVWVFDEGRQVFAAEQARIYAPLICVEAIYIAGVRVAQEVVV